MKNNVKNEKGLWLGVSIIAILVILMIAPFHFGFELGPFKEGPSKGQKVQVFIFDRFRQSVKNEDLTPWFSPGVSTQM